MLKNIIPDAEKVEARLNEIATSGFTVALNVRHLQPQFYVSNYPEEWIETYTSHHYAIHDPIVLWAATNEGSIRWSAIRSGFFMAGGTRIIDQGKLHGLNFGASVVRRNVDNNAKCAIFAARQDRELTDEEIEYMNDVLKSAIAGVGAAAGLSTVELESLRDLASGMTHQEIATQRGISAATVKKRIERARTILGAKNAVHAVSIATRRGLIIDDPLF